MYRGSRSRRSRGSFHGFQPHSRREVDSNRPRGWARGDRSITPEYITRRERLRSRTPTTNLDVEYLRERPCTRFANYADCRRSPGRRYRSRSPQHKRSGRGARSRSGDHNWDHREDADKPRRHRYEEVTYEEDERQSTQNEHRDKSLERNHDSRHRRANKNDKYHWTKPDHTEQGHDQVDENNDIHDLREIIKRSRDELRSPENRDYIESSNEYDNEFVPKSEEDGKTSRGHDLINYKISVHNDIAPKDGHFLPTNDSHMEIPFFDGRDQEITPRQFVKMIEDLGYANGWSTSELKCQMAAKLEGSAREWFLKDELMNESWERVKLQFIKMHPTDMDYFTQLRKMMERIKHDNESYSNYFTFKNMLMSAVEISGRRAVSCLIGGLQNKELEDRCYQKNFSTPDLLFEYLTKSESQSSTSKRDNHQNHREEKHSLKKGLLKTPNEFILNHSGNSQNHNDDGNEKNYSSEFVAVKPEYELKHLLTIKIKNQSIEAYNDMEAQSVTIKEECANEIHMDYSRRRATIIGYRGVPVMTLGDSDTRIMIDQVTVNCRVYVVPNICQDKSVVIGKMLREHPHVTYHESRNNISFQPRPYSHSFSEERK